MSTYTFGAIARLRPLQSIRPAALAWLVSPLLLAFIGIELAVVVAYVPDTFARWWHADNLGDFPSFYLAAKEGRANGFYSPALSLAFKPLTYLSIESAYRAHLVIEALALLAVAWIAQRPVRHTYAKVAIVLAIVALPQMQWALRLGHQTPFLALAALSGLLLAQRRPLLAGALLALLVIKPQYLPIPVLYLLWTRNVRALTGLLGVALGIELVGFAFAGFDSIPAYARGLVDLSAGTSDDFLLAQQAWQYAWQGFLISAGVEPHPLVAFDLMLISFGVVLVVWVMCERAFAAAAAALGMLLVTPYANFYDWGLLAVAAALLLRTPMRWPLAVPAMLLGLYAALLASQAATPFPAPIGSPEVGSTYGIYWITPATFAAACLLALLGGSRSRAKPVAPPDSSAL